MMQAICTDALRVKVRGMVKWWNGGIADDTRDGTVTTMTKRRDGATAGSELMRWAKGTVGLG